MISNTLNSIPYVEKEEFNVALHYLLVFVLLLVASCWWKKKSKAKEEK